MRGVLLLACATTIFAGQSIVLSTGSATNASVAAQTANHACRLVVSFHDWDANWNANQHLFDAPACGFTVYSYNVGGDVRLIAQDDRILGGAVTCQLRLGALATKFATLRFQRIPSGSGGTSSCEAYDISGNSVNTSGAASATYSSTGGSNSSGATVAGTGPGQNLSIAYYKLYTTTVLVGSKPPTTADVGDLLNWKFDTAAALPACGATDTLADTSGHSYNATLSGTAACAATPGQALVKAIIQGSNATFWAPWLSMRAGYLFGLDGTQSYTQADSGTLTYLWSLNSGPNAPTFSSTTAAQPTFAPSGTMPIFGNYNFSLSVSDGTNSASTTLDIGCVAYDANGMVLGTANELKLFGPQIAFGQNPWAYADERSFYAIRAQAGQIPGVAGNPYLASATWTTAAQGTVAYNMLGIGPSFGQTPGTSLTAGISNSATSIAIADASKLDFASLPTVILIGNASGVQEAVRIQTCTDSMTAMACTGGTTTATLTVAYDGRGLAGSGGRTSATGGLVRAQAWLSGDKVGQYKITGTGTLFSTDVNRPLAPAGLPGPPGAVTYSTGTVRLAASSTTVLGTGTLWTGTVAQALNIGAGVAGFNLRINATHAMGTSFVFACQIALLNSATSITCDRAAPADVDSMTDFTYKITSTRYPSLDFKDTGGNCTTGDKCYRFVGNLMWCETETACYGNGSFGFAPFTGPVNQTGMKISYKDELSAQSAFGPNFYGTSLAARMFYARSGYGPALTLANQIDEYWSRDPELCGSFGCNGSPLLIGGGIIGAFADKVLNGSTVLQWSDLRGWAQQGIDGTYGSGGGGIPSGCNVGDTRDTGYTLAWLALAGLFDTDVSYNPGWITGLTTASVRDQNCRRNAGGSPAYSGAELNSWATSYSTSLAGPALTTNGTATVTAASGLTAAALCAGSSRGTVTISTSPTFTVTVASTSLGSLSNSDLRIWITDGAGYTLASEYSFSGSTITLGGQWTGQTGTFAYLTENKSRGEAITNVMARVLTDSVANNHFLETAWACTTDSDTQLTLDRPFTGANNTDWHLNGYVLQGFFQQPYMLGIKTSAMKWASQVLDPTVSAAYATMVYQAANWMASYGLDVNTKGTFYGRLTSFLEPLRTPNPSPVFYTIQGYSPAGSVSGGFNGLATASGEYTERVATAEGGTALGQYYAETPISTRRDTVDQYYGALFGNCQYTSGGGATFYCDANYVGGELSNASLAGYKWPGFFFGMGGLFSNSWPAERTSLTTIIRPLQYTGGAHPIGTAK